VPRPTRRSRRTLRAAALAAVALGCLTACFPPSDADVAAVSKAVSDLKPPYGWVQVEPLDVACHPGHPGCEDDSSHRAFHAAGTVQTACLSVVSWVNGSTDVFSDPIAITGAETKTPTTAACETEITTVNAYIINTGSADPAVPKGARWAIRLFPDTLGGYRLSVVLGNPPRDPWKADSEG
jgi:hypothetical protein